MNFLSVNNLKSLCHQNYVKNSALFVIILIISF